MPLTKGSVYLEETREVIVLVKKESGRWRNPKWPEGEWVISYTDEGETYKITGSYYNDGVFMSKWIQYIKKENNIGCR